MNDATLQPALPASAIATPKPTSQARLIAGNAGKDRGCSNGRDGAVGEVAAEGEFPGGERGQRAGRNEDHAPHGPSQQGAQYANSHSNTREAGTV